VPLEELHRALVLLRRSARLERTEIPALAGLRILLAGVEPVLARAEFANHCELSQKCTMTLRSQTTDIGHLFDR
jgi:hypothetical protein